MLRVPMCIILPCIHFRVEPKYSLKDADLLKRHVVLSVICKDCTGTCMHEASSLAKSRFLLLEEKSQ